MTSASPIIVALDTDDRAELARWSAELRPLVGAVKVGLQAYVAHGPASIDAVRTSDAERADGHQRQRIFLDLKLHDIPNTVGRAAAAVAALGVDMLTVHAAGGPAMIAAAVDQAPDVDILAVTVLTSLDEATMVAVGQQPIAEQVVRLGRLAMEAGAAGLVCSSSDVERLRSALGDEPLLVVPGIRPSGGDAADQARVGTPQAAMAAGADWLVVGRPITAAENRGAAAQRITADALAGRQRRSPAGSGPQQRDRSRTR